MKAHKFTVEETIKHAWLGLGDNLDMLSIENPLSMTIEWEKEHPHLHILNIMRNPDNFPFTCKHLLGVEISPFQHAILKELWIRPFPMFIGSRGISKTYSLAIYTMLRLLFHQESKVVVCGAAFRQSKLVFEYIDKIWNNAPILRDLVSKLGKDQGIRKDIDRWYFRLGHSEGYAIPIGTGDKIRGLRANTVIADEFRSINTKVFEEVIKGFGAVTNNPIDAMKISASHHMKKRMGISVDSDELRKKIVANQAIISGTAGYIFENFGKYWKKYRDIVNSKGDLRRLAEIHGTDKVDENFDWRDYSVIRIPYDFIPNGYFDAKMIAQSASTSTKASYQLEYGAVFVEDSEGFFRRTLINSCACGGPADPLVLGNEKIYFEPQLKGISGKRYVYGIDPASESDNFSIVVLELHDTHRRIVHCWTTTRQKFKAKVNSKSESAFGENAFYSYINRKIRELMKVFPTEHIAMDKQGGGVGVLEELQNINVLKDKELPILPYIYYPGTDPFWWEEEKKETDPMGGLHIIHICQFANAEFVSRANHGMKQDMENKVLLFPHFDSAAIAIALEKDKEAEEAGDSTRIHNSLEDCTLEIEELKDELATITHTHTPGQGREHWDTPEIKTEGGKKGRQRKDRYSALLLANMAARTLTGGVVQTEYTSIGGIAQSDTFMAAPKESKGKSGMYSGNPHWNIDPSIYDLALVRRE